MLLSKKKIKKKIWLDLFHFAKFCVSSLNFCVSSPNPKQDLGSIKYWCFNAQNNLSETKFKIYTPKRDAKHPHLFHMGVPPPRGMYIVQLKCSTSATYPQIFHHEN